MAKVTEVTLSTRSRVTMDGQEREVGIALAWRLNPEDEDVGRFVRGKAAEVERLNRLAWKGIRDEAVAHAQTERAVESLTEDGASACNTTEAAPKADEEKGVVAATVTQTKALSALSRSSGMDTEEFEALLKRRFGCSQVSELSRQQAGGLLVELQRSQRERIARRRQ